MVLSPAGLMAYCELTGEPRFSEPNFPLAPGPRRPSAGRSLRHLFPVTVSALVLGVLFATFVVPPFAHSAADSSAAASRVDANKLAREVMENELVAQGRDQSL